VSLLRPALYALGALATYLVARRWWGRPMMPPLSTEFAAHNHGGVRAVTPPNIRLLVLHSTEGESARSTAAWFANAASPGSTHVVVDDKEGFRTLPDNVVPYGASGGDANTRGLHIEFSGHAAWTRTQWLQHDAMLQRGGAVLAAWAATYGIPLAIIGPQAVADRIAQGVTTHKIVTDAFHVVGGHQDPGDGFPLDVLLRYARGG